MTAETDDWENKYKKWKEYKYNIEHPQKIESPKITKDIKEIEEKTYDYLSEPKHVKTLKIIVLLIPLVIVGYLVYSNFIASQEFNYFYDIGSAGERYLTPISRISDSVEGNPNYRNLTSGLVYFDIPIARGSESVKVQLRFNNNSPEKQTMSLGAKDQEVWHYNYHSIYNPALNHLSEFPRIGNVFLINQNLSLLTLEELKYKKSIVVATDKQYIPPPNIISDYKNQETIINTSLRGGHTAYIYVSGNLILEVKKQDINWYDGSDELEISVYDLEDNLIANSTIEDDGITEVKNEETAKIQEGILQAKDLKEGIYKVEFGNFDGLIREIKVNTNKIVFQRVFLADNSIYMTETKPSSIYTKTNKHWNLEILTYHNAGIQNITYLENGENNTFNFSQEDASLYLNLSNGEYEFKIPQNDIILSGMPYLAFSKENYFEPFKQKVIPIKKDIEWLKDNVDYVVADYKLPEEDGEWTIAETEFNINKEHLFVKDNKLNIVFNIPHLSQEQFQNYTIPLDWIKIKVYKPGVFAK